MSHYLADHLADHLGSIVQQTNAAGAVTLTRQYDPYGVPLQGGGTSGYAFTGQQCDAETSLYFYRSRYYSATLARFLSEDAAGLAAGPNLYAYVRNASVKFRDPSGHDQTLAMVWAEVSGAAAVGAAGRTVILPGAGTVAGAIGAGLGALVVIGAAAVLAPSRPMYAKKTNQDYNEEKFKSDHEAKTDLTLDEKQALRDKSKDHTDAERPEERLADKEAEQQGKRRGDRDQIDSLGKDKDFKPKGPGCPD